VTAESIGRRWQNFWYEPDHALNLAAARIIVAAHALWHLASRDYAAMARITALWTDVPQMQRLRYLIFTDLSGLEPLVQVLAGVALVGALVGICPRVSCFVAGLSLYHLAPLETIFWAQQQPTGRGMTLAAPLLLILAASRSADTVRLWPRGSRESAVSWEYGWPRKLMWVLVAQIYLFAFISKMTMAGPGWAASDHMRRWFIAFNISDWWRFHELGLWISEHPGLCLAIGVATLVFQASFIAAVFSRRARYVLVPAAALFGLGTALTLNIHVGEGWLVLLFVNWWWLAKGREPEATHIGSLAT
jgi:hypothetical protein